MKEEYCCPGKSSMTPDKVKKMAQAFFCGKEGSCDPKILWDSMSAFREQKARTDETKTRPRKKIQETRVANNPAKSAF